MRTGELPSHSTHEFPSTPDASQQEASDFQDIARDPDKFVEGLGSPPAECLDPSIQKPVPQQEKKTLEDIISHSYKNDPSCSTVFTGNGKKEWSDEKKSETPDISYARVMAYSMAQDMCEQNELSKVFEKRYGKNDALNSELFGELTDGTKKSVNDHASTYALIYALGQRESAGNFNQPRDPSRSNLGITEEAGLTQTSANSLNLKGEPKEIDGLMKRVFRNYVTKLSAMKDQQERASFCLSDKMAGNKQTKEITIKGIDRFTSKTIEYDTQGSALQELFSTKESSCASIADEIQGDFIVQNKKLKMINCFKDLHKFCPGFSIKYGAAVARTQKNHHGPLKENQSKPAPRPSCHMLFNAIATGRDEICKELNFSSKTDETSIQTDDVSVVKNDTFSKTDTPEPGFSLPTKIKTEPINPYLIQSPAVSFDGAPLVLETNPRAVRNSDIAPRSTTPQIVSTNGDMVVDPKSKLTTSDVAVDIVDRDEWDPGWKNDPLNKRGKKFGEIGNVSKVTLHHTQGSNKSSDTTNLKIVKKVHVETKKWGDIGYHFIVPRNPVQSENFSGDVFEGAPLTNKGSHVQSKNYGNIGIALLGNISGFDPALNPSGSKNNEPTAYQVATVRKLVIMLKTKYKNLKPIEPHMYARESNGTELWNKWKTGQGRSIEELGTDCPGLGGLQLVKILNAEGL